MEIDVRKRGIEWNETLQKQIERSIEYAVDSHRKRIDRISVYLSDLNGPRGGVDKLCQMAAEVRGAGPILISETDPVLLAAIGRAARRLGFRIRRKIERGRWSGAKPRATIRAAK